MSHVVDSTKSRHAIRLAAPKFITVMGLWTSPVRYRRLFYGFAASNTLPVRFATELAECENMRTVRRMNIPRRMGRSRGGSYNERFASTRLKRMNERIFVIVFRHSLRTTQPQYREWNGFSYAINIMRDANPNNAIFERCLMPVRAHFRALKQ